MALDGRALRAATGQGMPFAFAVQVKHVSSDGAPDGLTDTDSASCAAPGPRLPLYVWAQLSALMFGEALRPDGGVSSSEALAWLDAADGLADPALEGVPDIPAARQALLGPMAARQAVSNPTVTVRSDGAVVGGVLLVVGRLAYTVTRGKPSRDHGER